MLYRCVELQSIYCSGSFDASGLTAYKEMLAGCVRLVGAQGANGGITASDQRTLLNFGAAGLLTDPDDDNRARYYGHAYEVAGSDMLEVCVSSSAVPDPDRTLVDTRSAFGLAKYQYGRSYPWYRSSFEEEVGKLTFLADVATLPVMNLKRFLTADYGVEEVTGLRYVPNCTTLEEALESNGKLEVLDLRGFDPSHLESIKDMFFSDSHIRTIYVDADWELPAALASQSVFTACTSLVGGAGTAYDGTRFRGEYLRIDGGPESETPGYCTVG